MKNQLITIDASTFFKGTLILLLFGLLYFLRDLVLVLLTAVVIASSIEPLTRWFGKYKIPRLLAVIFIYAGLMAILFGVLYLFLPTLLDETSAVMTMVSQQIETSQIFSSGVSGTGIVSELSANFSLQETIDGLRDIIGNISGNLFATISAIFGGLLSFVLILVISFYLAVQEKGIENFLRLITPLKHEQQVLSLWKRSQAKIGRWMQGQLLLGFIVGILVYLGLMILGVKNALLLAVLAALFELIPLFGPILASIPAIIFGFLDSFTLGLMVIGLYVIIQQFENHLIYPLVVRKVIGVSPIIVIISLVIGAKLAGFLGLILAVPVATAIMEFADDVQEGKSRELQEKKKA